MKKTLLSLFLLLPLFAAAQLRLTEIAPTNPQLLPDEDNDYPDWLEILNTGSTPAFLGGMSLSDNGKPKWSLPNSNLPAGQRLLIFASGKNRGGSTAQTGVDHWETAVNEGDEWRTFIGDTEPPADWAAPAFDDSAWAPAPGGFGYGDGDDASEVPAGILSFFYRIRFDVADPVKLDSAILSMDFDDGFVAWLNGVEIARSFNMPPGTPDFQTITTIDHEALLYGGGVPDAFPLDAATLNALLVPGENVLAIELHNVDPTSSDLSGRSWLSFGIATGEQFYGGNPVWFTATGTGGGGGGGELHTNFKISFFEKITLFDVNGDVLDSLVVECLQPGHSQIRMGDTGNWCITDQPSPDAANGNSCFSGYAETPVFSLPAGFYSGTQSVSISGNAVRFTTDGSEPTGASALFTSPIAVSSTAVVRARSFEAGMLPSRSATATYFMDDPSQLPVLSIVARPGDLFADGSGGPAVYDDYGSGLSAACHLDYFDADHNLAFSENASIRPVGGYSIAFEQKSMQFIFDEEFGAKEEVAYPIFGLDKPGITSYRGFRVRNMDDDWASARMRDVISNRISLPTHCASTGYQNMAVFINGEYWGHYGGRELTNEYYPRDNHGSNPDEVDMIFTSYFQSNPYFPDEGSDEAFFSMSDFLINTDLSDPGNYASALQLIDWENWTDYFATEIYIANGDWFSSMYFNNLRMYRSPGLPWRFLLFDTGYSQNIGVSPSTNILDEALANPAFPNRYTDMMNSLLQNDGFKNYFINRFADLLNEFWTPAKIHPVIEANAAEIAAEINRQSQRWGSLDLASWQGAVENLKDFHVERPAYQRQHIEEFFGLNGQVDVTLNVQPAGAGVVKISTIIPKNYPWTGIYFDGNPVTVTAIANPGFEFDHWTSNLPLTSLGPAFTLNIPSDANFTAHFSGSPQPMSLEVAEINYHSDPTLDAGDWFELHNAANYPLDLSDFFVQGENWYHRFPLPTGTVLPPDERLVLLADDDKFNYEHPFVANKLGVLPFDLGNNGDQIRLFDRSGLPLETLTFDDKKPWACTPDGIGRTLERTANNADPNLPESWFDGSMGGTPGTAYTGCDEGLIISEINYNSSPTLDAGDWLELHNRLNLPYYLSGWTIRDGNDDNGFAVPPGTVITPEGYLVICQNEAAFSAIFSGVGNKIGDLGFALAGGGEAIRLYDPLGNLRFSLCYDDDLPWTTEPDGTGYTLENGDYAGNQNAGGNWFAGCPGGSPGEAYDPACPSAALPHPLKGSLAEVFPNPVDNQLFVRFEQPVEAALRLRDVFGKTVLEEKMNGAEKRLDLGQLAAGAYWLEIRTGAGWQVIGVIK